MLQKIAEHHYRLDGMLDIQHPELLAELMALATPNRQHLELDCSGLKSCDSLLLASILFLARQLEQRHGLLTINHFPVQLEGLAKTYGVDSLIHHYCSNE